ncbi:M16 family metallopeptidase [Actinoplanes sp. CA-142083]|uniref:M16 family metallopeptidase n=1 Tax=Actinoplanes sp. CA-142083 TaxID=3239903 RepID=UPI003D91ED96
MTEQLEIDGIPALIAPTRGPMHAGLVFRVGLADETLARRGVTHLVEHLALHASGASDLHYNGATGVEYTYFHLQGTGPEIAEFLNGVCAALSSLPMHRLAVEKEILRTEAAGRRPGVADPLPLWRHGARDFGLSSYPEWGLPALTENDLYAWTARYFTRENAALWIAGDEVPAGLRLVLPPGERRRPPAASSALPRTPAFARGSSTAVVWDAVVRREPRAAVFASVLERRMFRELRQEGGLSYSVQASYEGRADGTALITAAADALPENRHAVLGGMVDVLAAMEAGRITPPEVQSVVDQACDDLAHAEERGGRLPGQAMGLLVGRPVQSLEEARSELRAVTSEQVAEVAAAACGAGLLITPAGAGADWAGYDEAPVVSDSVVTGRSYLARDAASTRLVIGAEGVSLTGPDGPATIRFAECEAMLVWPDGGRRLIGADGITVSAEPTHYWGAGNAIRDLDQRVPEQVRVLLPGRDRIPPPFGAVPPIWSARWWALTAKSYRRVRNATTDEACGLLGIVLFPILAVVLLVGEAVGRFAPGPALTVGFLALMVLLTAGGYWVARPYFRRTRGF